MNLLYFRINMLKKLFCILFFLIISSVASFAQSKISGQVTESGTSPLPGVNVTIKGSAGVGTITNMDGSFELSATPEDILVFSFVGFTSHEEKVGNRNVVNVDLKTDVQQLEAVVVVGYGEQKERDITGSVGMVKTEALQKLPVSNVSQAMQGRMTGVQVSNSTEPGGDVKVRIRGVSTITGNQDPIYVIDGIITGNLQGVDPNDIESISVLKDASSAAIYGNRGANGVVIVKTKGGQKGDVKYNFSAEFGMQTPMRMYEMMNTQQFKGYAESLFTTGQENTIKQNRWVYDDDITQTTDWSAETFKPAAIQRYNFAAAGGGDNGSYRVSMGYINQEGMQHQTGYERYNMNVKSNYKTGRFSMGETMMFSYAKQTRNGVNYGGPYVMNTAPQIPVFDPTAPNGYGIPTAELSGQVNTKNPIYSMETSSSNYDKIGTNVSLWAQYEFRPGLTFKSNINGNFSFSNRTDIQREIDQGTALHASIMTEYGENRSVFSGIFWDNYFNYSYSKGKSDLNATVGGVVASEEFSYLSGKSFGDRDGLESASGGVRQSLVSDKFTKRMLSSFARAVYTYDDKYIFNASVRSDASSQFSENNRTGYFPSVSVGWMLAEEDFMAQFENLSNLKLRAGYGEVGRDLSITERYVAQMYPWVFYPFPGGSSNNGSVVASKPDPNLQWETSKQINLGIDLGFFDDKLRFVVEGFRKTSDNTILNVKHMADAGTGTDIDAGGGTQIGGGFRNIGTIVNDGVEIGINYDNFEGDFTYAIGGNFTYVTNKVTALNKIGGQDVPITAGDDTFTQRIDANESMWYFYGYQTAGIFRNQSDVDNHVNADGTPLQPNAQPGDIRFVDTDGSGKIDGDDRINLGNSIPKYYFGFNFDAQYKGFDFSMMLEGKAGFQVFNQNRYALSLTTDKENRLAELDGNTWTEENPNADYPRINTIAQSNFFSDRHLQSGAYLNFQNIQIGYDLTKVVNSSRISKMRVYAGINNAYILTNYKGYNPDVWDNGGNIGLGAGAGVPSVEFNNSSRPTPRTYLLGLQMNF
ncbi:SusC/RagA family TonB-linked outer membrane protein (plasmid) [Persicobacter psychrovividus]|uniref:SusC/RagA family TonB-linked outer membrane protein n=1 Tax=Persicobacter psychrovividus TaxID=387638 RepID=A0ABM7VLG0_9BACT|nr:SusC/RagA family TonB-linked outer membrane protein [Persicobacter psychrovividus]